MIYQLAKNDHERTRPLFVGLEYNLVVLAVIEGANPGRIYADDAHGPSSAFLCSAEGYYLGGDPGNDAFNLALGKRIADRIFAGDTIRPGEDQLDLRFCPDTWENQLDVILEGKSPIMQHRRHYVCRGLKVSWQDRIPEGFSVRRIDGELLQMPGISNAVSPLNRYAIDKMKGNWGSIDTFLQRGIGFCMLHGEEPVCWCIADCASEDACEVGIRTHPDYRRRGLATCTVAATVDHCLLHGFNLVGWHCWDANIGSIGVAQRVGFELERTYLSYVRMFDDAYHLAETGLVHFMAGRYIEAARCYEQAFALRADPFPHQYYHLAARAWAVQGERDMAYKYLHMAIDHGENRSEHTRNCNEFVCLHGEQEWQDLLARLEEKTNGDAQGRNH